MEKSGTIAKTKIIRGSEPTAGAQFIKETMQSFRKLEKCACCWIIGMCGLLKYASGKKKCQQLGLKYMRCLYFTDVCL